MKMQRLTRFLLIICAMIFCGSTILPVQAYSPPGDNYLCDFPAPLKRYRYYRWYPEEFPLKIYVPAIPNSYGVKNRGMYFPLVRSAFGAWSQRLPGLRFTFVNDPSMANIKINWLNNFPESESTWGSAYFPQPQKPNYQTHKSQINLAVRAQKGTGMGTGAPLFSYEELMAVTVHEVGHSLGLPHSKDPEDIMTPYIFRLTANTKWKITRRDINTLLYLYRLPKNLKIPPCNGK